MQAHDPTSTTTTCVTETASRIAMPASVFLTAQKTIRVRAMVMNTKRVILHGQLADGLLGLFVLFAHSV